MCKGVILPCEWEAQCDDHIWLDRLDVVLQERENIVVRDCVRPIRQMRLATSDKLNFLSRDRARQA